MSPIARRRRALTEQSDEQLVEQSRKNDHEAFAELVDRYKHRIHWIVRRMVGSEEDEDLTQEIFLRVYRALPGFRRHGSFSTWIYKIARNLCISELRRRERRGEHLSLDDMREERVHALLPESQDDLDQQIERRDTSERVQQLIRRLPTHYRLVLTLFYLNQLRYEEIAEIMEIPLGTVKTYIHRAKLCLRDLVLVDSKLAELAGEPCSNTVDNGA
jgi:RNA polymerase sigma-70 factor (ECF subfamily)